MSAEESFREAMQKQVEQAAMASLFPFYTGR
jgi:hypothetical protein